MIRCSWIAILTVVLAAPLSQSLEVLHAQQVPVVRSQSTTQGTHTPRSLSPNVVVPAKPVQLSPDSNNMQWRSPGQGVQPSVAGSPAPVNSRPSVTGSIQNPVAPVTYVTPVNATAPVASQKTGSLLKVTKGLSELPNKHGQVWRDYDITPYTTRVTSTAKPEQALIDWILRETGTDVWFSEPLGMLHADQQTLRVYHTPEMQEVVRDVVQKFVDSQAGVKTIGVRMVTVKSPNWRRTAYRMLQPVSTKTPGIEAWLLSKEHAAVLLSGLKKRSDYKEHKSADLLIHNGQSSTISMLQPRSFVRSVQAINQWPGYELKSDSIEEGFTFEVSPLLSPDNLMIDTVIKCSVDQVEKFVDIDIDLPEITGQRQSVKVQIPQMVSWRLHERFRWPGDKVLLISCGVVARPEQGLANAPTLLNPFGSSPPRADGLLFVEYKGAAKSAAGVPITSAAPAAIDTKGRY